MMLRHSAAIGVLVAFSGLFFSATARPSLAEAPADKGRAVSSLIQAEMAARGIPGAQVAIVQKHKIVFSGAFGLATLNVAIPLTPHTVFPINSISKAVASVAVMQLVEAGHLDLEALLRTYIESLPSAWGAVTVRHAFTHMSSLPEIVDDKV